MRNLLIAIIFTGFSTLSFSQSGTKKLTLVALTDSIKTIIEQQHIAGLMLGITTRDSVLFSGGFGYADIQAKRKADGSTLFRMGSVTKMFVSLAIMKLVQEGKLNLNDKLSSIAPEVPFLNPWEATDPVRIVQLLEHSTGFDDVKLNHMYSLDQHENKGIDMMLIHASSMICRWKPGERTAYSNPNYAVLGYIIEKLTGKPYNQYLKDIILDPLDMRSSNFNVNSKFPRVDTREYTFRDGQLTEVPSVTLLSGPQGALWSNAEDMTKFLQLFLRNGDPLVSSSTIQEIETPHSSLAAKSGLKSGYALGNRIGFVYNKYPFRGHDGITGTCYSSCFYNHELNIGFIISSNSDRNHYAVEQLVMSFIEQNFPDHKLVSEPLDQKEIQPFLGAYEFESPRNEIAAFSEKVLNFQRIYVENGQLYLKPLMGSPARLVQTAPLIFAYEGMNTPLIIFTKSSGNNIMSIGGSYFIQTSLFTGMLKRILLVIAVIFSLSTLLFAMISLIGVVRSMVQWKTFVFRALPVAGLLALMFSVRYLFEIKDHSYRLYELSSMNAHSVAVCLGTLLFAITSFIYLGYVMNCLRTTSPGLLQWYMILTGTSLISITVILLDAGWIGLRSWSM
jgi:CubicO group peptidase (beta-lactamase class C family)